MGPSEGNGGLGGGDGDGGEECRVNDRCDARQSERNKRCNMRVRGEKDWRSWENERYNVGGVGGGDGVECKESDTL